MFFIVVKCKTSLLDVFSVVVETHSPFDPAPEKIKEHKPTRWIMTDKMESNLLNLA